MNSVYCEDGIAPCRVVHKDDDPVGEFKKELGVAAYKCWGA